MCASKIASVVCKICIEANGIEAFRNMIDWYPNDSLAYFTIGYQFKKICFTGPWTVMDILIDKMIVQYLLGKTYTRFFYSISN